jgi:threonine/homoserine/homoserine lactone efflux protein
MIDSATFLVFVLGSLALVASPGPDFLYVLSRGIAQGPKAGVLSAFGISLGLLVHTALAALGLTVLLQTSFVAFQIVKFAGAIYLIYLGVKMLRGGTLLQGERRPVENSLIVRQAMLTNVFNPKAALTFLAFLPQFVKPGHGSTSLQVLVLGVTLVLLALVWFSLIGTFAGAVGAWLHSRPRFSGWVQTLTGSVLIALGVRLAFARR